MEFADNTFDGVFALEATCHAKDPVIVYKEIFRVLKPGALFVETAWTMTDNYDPQNAEHVKIKNGILVRFFFSESASSPAFVVKQIDYEMERNLRTILNSSFSFFPKLALILCLCISFHPIQIGNGLPDLKLQPEILEAVRKAGFEVVEFKNGHRSGDLPW